MRKPFIAVFLTVL